MKEILYRLTHDISFLDIKEHPFHDVFIDFIDTKDGTHYRLYLTVPKNEIEYNYGDVSINVPMINLYDIPNILKNSSFTELSRNKGRETWDQAVKKGFKLYETALVDTENIDKLFVDSVKTP